MRVLKSVFRGFRWLIYLVIAFLLLNLLFTSFYDFHEFTPFHGENFHNPYEGLKEDHWKIGNFHAHSRQYYGLTNGVGTDDDLYTTYNDSLGYDIIGISNYQKMTNEPAFKKSIPVYEHGYGPTKNHHIVIGSSEVRWTEFFLPQFVHQKQHIINRLKDGENNLVAIAHPKRGKAFTLEDMRHLSGYDCVEALNHLSSSLAHWDAALSAGNPVYILSNDDTHDHSHIGKSGRNATMVYLPKFSTDKVITALKSGQSYGIEFTELNPNFRENKQRIQTIGKPKSIEMHGDTLWVSFNQQCSTITFVGQQGEVKKLSRLSDKAFYVFRDDDTYIRTEVMFNPSRSLIYLNPVFRYADKLPISPLATVNARETRLFKMAVVYVFIGFWMLVIRIEFGKRVRRKRKRKVPKLAFP